MRGNVLEEGLVEVLEGAREHARVETRRELHIRTRARAGRERRLACSGTPRTYLAEMTARTSAAPAGRGVP